MFHCETLTEVVVEDAIRFGFKFNFTDNHMHIDPRNGEGIAAVKKFQKAGGKFLFLVCKTTKDVGIELKNESSFEKLYEYTISLSKEINERTEVKSFPVIGMHPAEVVEMCKHFSIEKAQEIGRKALEAAVRKVSEGYAVAIGEVGRPHFKVGAEVLDVCNKLLAYAFELAAEIDCAVQLHTESVAEKHFEEFRKLAEDAGLNPSRIIKHYSSPLINAGERTGIYPSLIASEENISGAIQQGNRFLMESDYIDDLHRPGSVVGPKSVPKVGLRLFEQGALTEEDLWKIHKDNVEDAYNIELV